VLCGVFPVLLAAAACSPAGRALVTEVYYDAIGDDTGYEFVELWNPTPDPIALNGVRLEAGDGAGPGRWTLRWTGSAADSVAAGARFVVGGAQVSPAPQRIVSLDLQNGPDAVRVVWSDGTTEVVGYGTHTHPEYFCGAPAADVPSGFSLARVPDGADSGGNAADFRAAIPSPGRANQARRNLAVPSGSLAIVPAWPGPGEPIRLSGRLANAGADTIGVGELSVSVEVEPLDPAEAGAGPTAMAVTPPVLGPLVLLPGDTLAFEHPLDPLPAGRHRVWLIATAPGDEVPSDDRDSLRFRVGEGPLAVSEIQFHPADAEGEWIEVRNRSGYSLDLDTYTFSDRGTARGVPRDGFGALPPESLAVMAQDRLALLAAFPALAPERVWEVSPWAALNNSDDSTGIADQVVIRDADGLVAERVGYHAGGVPAGVPLEWREAAWQVALDPRGTPLSPPRALPPAARRFDLAPARVPGRGGVVNLAWALPWARARVRADLYDLDGRRVAELMPDLGVAGRGTRELRLEGLAPGVFWVVLESRAETGGGRATDARPLRVTGPP